VVDTAAMAEQTEVAMLARFGETNKEYKARFRALMFNLRDPKNPEFIRHVMTGQLFVENLASMEVKEMASDEVKKQRQAYAEHAKMALMDEKTYQKYAGKKQEDGILKCPKCRGMKTEYVEVQTRSADEPTTKKCLCTECDYRWKFC
jgi:transcription elongation factor S-II